MSKPNTKPGKKKVPTFAEARQGNSEGTLWLKNADTGRIERIEIGAKATADVT